MHTQGPEKRAYRVSTCALRPYDHAAKWTVAVITKPRCSFPFNALPYPSSMQLACWEASGVVLHHATLRPGSWRQPWLPLAEKGTLMGTHGYSCLFLAQFQASQAPSPSCSAPATPARTPAATTGQVALPVSAPCANEPQPPPPQVAEKATTHAVSLNNDSSHKAVALTMADVLNNMRKCQRMRRKRARLRLQQGGAA